MLKALCGELVNDLVDDCRQCHDGFGHMRASAIECLAREARVGAIGSGATATMPEAAAKRL